MQASTFLDAFQQRLGVLQVGGVEAFGEPVVKGLEERAGLGASALALPETREARRGAKLPRPRLLLERERERAVEARSVGMYQITDGTFEEAKRYCIHDHVVVEEGPWYAWRSCWLNELYFRVMPSHAIELTAAFLDRAVSWTLARHRIHGATRAHKQRLAALIHLCGPGSADRLLRRGLDLPSGLRCGDHDARDYVARVEAMTAVFAALAAREH